MPRASGRVLLGLRLALVILATLLLLNPYWTTQVPVRDGFSVGILADLSGSMSLADLRDGRSRIDFVREALDRDSSSNLRARLAENYHLRVSGFSHHTRAIVDNDLELMPGVTAIGDSLLEKAANMTAGGGAAGAIVLLSDGISLDGLSLAEAGITLREMDIPVTVVGVGESRAAGDIELRFVDPPAEVERGEPIQLELRVRNQFPRRQRVAIEFFEATVPVETREVDIAGADEAVISFEATPMVAGPIVYRARLRERIAGDINPANDSAFVLVDVLENRTREILYLTTRPDLNFRYLRMGIQGNPDFKMRSIIKLGPERYLYGGFKEDQEDQWDGFPEDESIYLGQNVIVVDAATLNALPPGMADGFRRFLAERGGGVLVFGNPAEVASEWRFLFPLREAEFKVEQARPPLQLFAEPVFTELAGGVLFTAPPLFLPEGEPVLLAAELSLSARPAMELRRGGDVIMAVQAYGAGRSAWLGTASTWRWRMDSNRGMEQHSLFWQQLLDWLGSAGRPRVEMPLQGAAVSLDEAVELDVLVRGRDFRPLEDGTVEAIVTGPDGLAGPPLRLTASPFEPGRFTGRMALDRPGEYRIDYRINPGDGENIEREAFFVADFTGRESRDLRFRENELRDLARITGGRYYAYHDMDAIRSLNLSSAIPVREVQAHWARSGWFLVLLLLVACLEWFMRRRYGLH